MADRKLPTKAPRFPAKAGDAEHFGATEKQIRIPAKPQD
jgi:hypothetical protein